MAWLGSLGVFIVIAALSFTAWLYLLGPWRAVDMSAQAPAPQPPLTTDPEAWRSERSVLLEAFQREVYGTMPALITPVVTSPQEIGPERAGGVERVEQWRVELGDAGHFHMAIARPPGDAPAPVILILDFCGNEAAFPNRPSAIEGPVGYIQWFCRFGALDSISERLFGRYINGPPFARITDRGYAVALVYPGDIVPDRDAEARAALARFASPYTGALMAWAWTASRAYDALAADPRFDARRIALWGQSRQGKAALIAGAFDERFAAIVALQTGRGGDAPTRAFAGESRAHMTRVYPHWFSPSFARETPSVEQHQLLALIAPRPLLVGHAVRDGWSDPVGARAVRKAAAPVFGTLRAAPPGHFIREGGHGITARDWDETLNFLDARMRS
ncbi:MAG: glucuronyl esterase domain-containing protein [Caulobacteraceae bacterium]